MTKAFDKTLEAIADLEDATALVKTEMTVSDSRKSKDLQKIVSLLDQASNLVVDAVVIFRKYEKLQ
jgi:hypothetical protein